MKFMVYFGTPGNKYNSGKACIGLKCIKDMEAFYWNPNKNVFQLNAADCWFPANQLREKKLDFVEKQLTLFIQEMVETK